MDFLSLHEILPHYYQQELEAVKLNYAEKFGANIMQPHSGATIGPPTLKE